MNRFVCVSCDARRDFAEPATNPNWVERKPLPRKPAPQIPGQLELPTA